MARQRRWMVYIDGLDDLQRMFKNMEDETADILEDATKKGAEFIRDTAEGKAPVRHGKLKGSIDIKLEKKRRNTKRAWQIYSKGVSKGGVRYGFVQESGAHKTKNIDAQPFLRPALDENKEKVKEIVAEELGKAIDRTARG